MKPLFTQSRLLKISLSLITIGFIILYYGSYRSFNCPWSEDMAIINQICYSFVTELSFRASIMHLTNSLAEEHFRLILVLISPIYYIFKSAFALTVLSILSVSITIYMILRIFEIVLGDNADIRPFFLIVLLYPSTVNTFLLFGGNYCVFAMMFFSWSILFYLQNKFFPWMAACILASFCAEYTSLILVGYAFISIIHRKNPRWIIFASTFGLGYFYLVNGLIMPSLRGGGGFAGVKFDEYSHLGRNPQEIILHMLSNPLDTIKLILQPQKILFLIKLMIPLLFIPVLGFEYLLIPISQYLLILLTKAWYYPSLYWWYYTPVLPFVFTAAAIGMKRLEHFFGNRIIKPLTILILIVTLCCSLNFFSQVTKYGKYLTQVRQPLWNYLESIPDNASVCAQWPFLPKVSSRKETFIFPDLQQSDYVILGYFRNKSPVNDETYKLRVTDLLKGSDYGVVAYFDNGDIILKKGYPNIKNDDCLHFILSASSHSKPL